MNKLFRGQVKISEVQEAFDEIVDRVNNIIDEYNTQVYVNNLDYTRGSKSLSPTGYTLSVGGLKLMLKNLEGYIFGGKAFKVNNNRVKMTTGILIHNGQVIKLPDSVVAVNSSTKHIYFNTSTNTYSTTTGVKICDLNMLRDTKMVTDVNNIASEEITNRKYKILSQTKDYTTGHKFIDWDGGFYENLDTSSSPKFLSAINALEPEGCQIRMFNTVVDEYSENGDRANQVWSPMVYLFIPKGVSSPYTYYQRGNQVNVNKTNQKVLDVKIERKK